MYAELIDRLCFEILELSVKRYLLTYDLLYLHDIQFE